MWCKNRKNAATCFSLGNNSNIFFFFYKYCSKKSFHALVATVGSIAHPATPEHASFFGSVALFRACRIPGISSPPPSPFFQCVVLCCEKGRRQPRKHKKMHATYLPPPSPSIPLSETVASAVWHSIGRVVIRTIAGVVTVVVKRSLKRRNPACRSLRPLAQVILCVGMEGRG